jgi:septal ring factor EnvC (AmiA/AmiB activator)
MGSHFKGDVVMKTRTFFAAVSLGLLAACAQISPLEAVQNTSARKAPQSARTRSDHDALTKYFEDAAREMHNKAEEQKKLLEHYEEKSYLYGRQAQDLESHTSALIRKYETAEQASMKEAALHRRMAKEATKQNLTGTESSDRFVASEPHLQSN